MTRLTFKGHRDVPDEQCDNGEKSDSLIDGKDDPDWIDHAKRSGDDGHNHGDSLHASWDRIDLWDRPAVMPHGHSPTSTTKPFAN